MMKRFARWIYMVTHHTELVEVAKYARRDPTTLSANAGLTTCGQIEGALHTLETLNLLDR